MKIAIVHDWMTGMGEEEQVLLAFAELFPHADLFTLMYHPEPMDPVFRERRVISSLLQRFHLGRLRYKSFAPFFWGLTGGFKVADYDLIVSSSRACAKWVRNPKKALHVCYCHTPMKALWGPEEGSPGFPVADFFRPYLQRCDLKSNEGVTHFLAPNKEVQGRIRTLYGRDSEVFSPPQEIGMAKFLFKMQVYFRRLHGFKTINEN